jgi:SAM-dependent methyltransferase
MIEFAWRKREVWNTLFSSVICCPVCGELRMILENNEIHCRQCRSSFEFRNGLPHLYSDEFRNLICKFEEKNDSKLSEGEKILKANMRFHNSSAEGYDTDPAIAHLLSKSGRSLIGECVEHCRKRTDGEVWIDAGCGTGQVMSIGRKFPVTLGFDISEGMATIAKAKGHFVFIGVANHIPVASSTADLVTACALLHHLPDPEEFLLEAFRILKPGGMLFTDFDPNNRCSHSRPFFRFIRQSYRFIKPKRKSIHTKSREIQRQSHLADYHMYYNFQFNGEFIGGILRKIGFNDIRVDYYFDKSGLNAVDRPPLGMKLRRMLMAPLNGIFSVQEIAPLFLALAQKPIGFRDRC